MSKRKVVGKFFIKLSLLLILIGSRNFIQEFIVQNFVLDKNIVLENKNKYYLNYNYSYIKNLEEFKLTNKADLLDLYYTIINSGVDEFNFYCPKEYTGCIEDVKALADDQDTLSDINGFVHPFNSFDTLETTYDTFDRVNVKIIKTYTDKDIDDINKKVDEIIKDVVKSEKDPKKIIQLIHDYIIEKTKYDKERADKDIINYDSNTAYGVLFQGYGVCNGYADIMSIFLNRYNIPNYKISSTNHIWNAVKLDNTWYHLDLTWDDPITKDGKEVVLHDYFLISTAKLKTLDKTQHSFNTDIYPELKEQK